MFGREMLNPGFQRTNSHACILAHRSEPVGRNVLITATAVVQRFRDLLGDVAAAQTLDVVRVTLSVDGANQACWRRGNNNPSDNCKDCNGGRKISEHRVERGVRKG